LYTAVYVLCFLCFFFFFSSRRRHTRSVSAFLLNRSSDLDLSSKVTVADVLAAQPVTTNLLKFMRASIKMIGVSNLQSFIASMTRSEERRVGKEYNYRGSPQYIRE